MLSCVPYSLHTQGTKPCGTFCWVRQRAPQAPSPQKKMGSPLRFRSFNHRKQPLSLLLYRSYVPVEASFRVPNTAAPTPCIFGLRAQLGFLSEMDLFFCPPVVCLIVWPTFPPFFSVQSQYLSRRDSHLFFNTLARKRCIGGCFAPVDGM